MNIYFEGLSRITYLTLSSSGASVVLSMVLNLPNCSRVVIANSTGIEARVLYRVDIDYRVFVS